MSLWFFGKPEFWIGSSTHSNFGPGWSSSPEWDNISSPCKRKPVRKLCLTHPQWLGQPFLVPGLANLLLTTVLQTRTNLTRSTTPVEQWWNYCKRPEHIEEKYWKLYGKPSSREWGQKGGPTELNPRQAHAAVQNQASTPDVVSIDDIEKRIHLNQHQLRVCVHSSLGLNASSDEFRNAWTLDSSATDHMKNTSNRFLTHTPCPSNRKITINDGTTSTVAGIESIQNTHTLILKNVPHVPCLSTNLISIYKLTSDLMCWAVSSNSCCEFQDQNSRKKIRLAKEFNGLYY